MTTLRLPALYADNAVTFDAVGTPVLLNRDPCPGESGVPIESRLALELLDTGPDGIERSATRIWVNDTLAFEGGGAPELQPGFDGPDALVTETADTLRVLLHPTVFFQSLQSVTVRVLSETVGGADTLDINYAFEVEDRTAPRLLAAQATDAYTVRLSFDEPVTAPADTVFLLAPQSVPAVTPAVLSANSDGSTLALTFDREMTPDVGYLLTVSGVLDAFSNPILPPHDQVTFAGFRPARPSDRRFDLWTMLPRHNRRDDTTGDLWRFIASLQETLDLMLAEVDRFPDIFDLERAPEPFLDLILQDLGNPFPFDLDLLSKRRLAAVLVEMYRQKGTALGVENAIRFFLDIDVEAITPFTGTTLVLGESELGVDWELGPSDSFARYAFDVIVDQVLTDIERSQIRAIVEYLKPAHTHFVDLVEPIPPVDFDHWVMGESELGWNTLLH